MMKIQKLDGYKQIEWNGTLKDLEGFNIKVTDTMNTNHYGSVKNGMAVSNNRHSVVMISKALKSIQ